MMKLLPARVRLLLALALVLLGRPALATHLLGGELTYRYLDANGPAAAPLRYELTVTIYNNCASTTPAPAAPNANAVVGIYDQSTGAKVNLTSVNYTTTTGEGQTGIMYIPSQVPVASLVCTQPRIPTGCTNTGPTQPFKLQKFIGIVNLPINAGGYYAVFTRNARNTDVTNLSNPGSYGLTLYATLTPPLLPNRSPVFSDTAVAIICQGDTTILLNNAVDADGDRLVYSFGQPYGATGASGVVPTAFAPPPAMVPYATAAYSATTPLGASGYASLNASTGIARYRAAPGTAGSKYVVAVDVREYRTINGQETLIGTTRRDLQLVVGTCPTVTAPVLPPVASTPRSYTIEQGQTLTIPITVTQADGHALALTLNSVLLDGAGGYNATLNGNAGTVTAGNSTGTATVTGTGSVTGTFVYRSACGDARATAYDIALTAKDQACGGKTVVDVFRITVVKPSGPTAIAGDASVCGVPSTRTYTASGGTAPGVSWRAVGGTIVGSRTANPVQVTWTAASGGTLVARGLSQYGCLTDSVTQAITVVPVPTLAVAPAGPLAVCQGSSATITVSGAGTAYTVTGGPVAGTSPTFVLAPTQTTTYTITSTATTSGCVSTTQVTVTVNPLPTATVGAATRATCAGVPIALGAAPVAGNTYSWSPSAGLSSSTIANPTLTLANPGTTPLVQTYTLTETNPATGCQATNSVTVTVNPAAVAVAGPAQTVCDGSTVTLGRAALAGYSYQWTPAANLSSASAAQPVLAATNTTAAPITLKYVVLATTAQGCSAKDSVLLTVNPRPAADSILGARSVCPTITGVAYAVKNPRSTTYQWTVAGGTIASGQGTAAITVNWGAAGTGAVSAYATNAYGCASGIVTLPITINPQLQTVKPSGPTSVCQLGGPYAYSTLAVSGSLFAWQLFGSAAGTLVSTGNTTSLTFTAPGVAKLVVTETSNPAGGICRGVSDTLYITVKPSPSAALAIQGPARFCTNGGPQTYTLGGAAGSTYVFQLNGTTIPNTNGTVTIPYSPLGVPVALAPGPYTLTAQETSANGCTGPVYTKAFVIDPQPGAITINGPRFVCPATRTLTYTVPNATATSTYQWTVAGGDLASGQGTATVTVSFLAALTTNATVSVTETSQYGCAGQAATITVVPDNAQAPQLTLASVVATDNTRVTLTFSVANAASTPNQVRVLRRAAGSTAAFVQVGTVAATATTYTDATANAAQTAYDYTLALTNGCGDELPSPVVHTTVLLRTVAVPATPNGSPRNQGSSTLTWTAYQGFAVASYQIYQQNDNNGYNLLATVSGSTFTYSVANTGQGFDQCFRVVAVSGDPTPRLANSNTSCVEFTNGLAFYNIITPNNDGQNDKLEILNVQLYPGNTMTIFNRWGREVFSTTNYNNDNNYWGTDPGVAPGVYYYLFKLPNGNTTKGWVEVVK